MKMSDFQINIGEQELIKPETPTPNEIKYLSNIDDQMGLRNHIPFIHVYPSPPKSHLLHNPLSSIRHALSRTLVHYYPIAGRLRQGNKGKLVVECNGEGVVYREARTNVSIEQMKMANGGSMNPPFKHLDHLLVDDVWGCNLITDSPLLRVQMLPWWGSIGFACGGFTLAYTFNHCICDGFGAHQFITALAQLTLNPARTAPTTLPSWSRHLLSPRSPPATSYPLPEYDNLHYMGTKTEPAFRSLAQTSVFLSRSEISSLKAQTSGGATFDAIASCLWQARTIALGLTGPVRLLFPVDTRARHRPLLPDTYYGAAVVFPCLVLDAEDVKGCALRKLSDLIGEVKGTASEDEYRRTTVDFIEGSGRRGFCEGEGVFVVSDMSRLRFADVDFGLGRGLYGGPARAGTGTVPGMVTSLVGCRRDDVEGILALVSLADEYVDAFHEEVRKIVGNQVLKSAL